ncbi:MAG TPA: 4-hydroxy-tetrahydrodipicolinate synthase [Chloroflexota bacterium]|nr:4-hydroxy-tetrahydrodipicolinate synthase [Chloroflexota bacterium]
MQPFGRLITAMATPFADDGSVDYPRARQLADALLASGTQSLVIAGTTGEAPTMTHQEKARLFSEIKDAVGDRAAVIAGTCGYDTAESVRFSQEAERLGVDGILGTVPWYNKPPQAGLERHFRAIADAVSIPILLYNIPSRTSTNMLPETTIRLSRTPNIVGVKEASGNMEAIATIIRDAEPGFRVWSGDDAVTLPILALGGYGVVSVASHLVGRQLARMIACAVEGVPEEAARIHASLSPLFSALFATTSPIPLKYALARCGFSCGGLRLPLVEIDERSAQVMDRALAGITVDLPAPAPA